MKKKVAIIGGGAAALSLACFLDSSKFEIHLFEKNKALGRKFLVAGKGGFNLTHGEDIEKMILRYTPPSFLKTAIKKFSNDDFRIWLTSIGVPTFVGSSNRIYPEKGMKPIDVLRSIQNVIALNNAKVHLNKTWNGWNENDELSFVDGENFKADYAIFAMGGASWKVTGSDGSWKTLFEEKGIKTNTFIPSNCAYKVAWPEKVKASFSGTPLKNISITCGNQTQKGEVVITETGLEGNAIYALSPNIRKELNHGPANISIDLKSKLGIEQIISKLKKSSQKTISKKLRYDLKLSLVKIELLKEFTPKEVYLDVEKMARKIKSFEIDLIDTATIDEAISTVGGIDLSELSPEFELIKQPNTYCIGEMTDWDAPTGGYLLQACFSMGYYLANHLNNK